MDVEEFYAVIEGDYEDVCSRLKKDERIRKYLGKFDTSSEYGPLCEAVAAGDWDAAFRASHTLKGVALNLGISKLGSSASDLCELVRNGEPNGDVGGALEALKVDYAHTVEAISRLD